MHKPVEMTSRLLDLVSHLVVALHVEEIRDHVQCVLVILHFIVEARQVEAVGEVVLVNLAKVFIAAR